MPCNMKGYKTHNFMKLATAKRKARAMRKTYGYWPNVFKVKNPRTGKMKYTVVQPKKLKMPYK